VGCVVGKGRGYTPIGRFALVDVEIDTLEFGPERVLGPEVRVNDYRQTYLVLTGEPKHNKN
jgi:hypothetical protein